MKQESRCVNCGDNIEKDYILFINGSEYTFDSFECAINFSAHRCSNCGTIITGRAVRKGEDVFCSLGCSKSPNYSPIVP